MSARPASALVPTLAQHIKGKTILVLGASPNSLGARFLEAIKPAEPGLIILGLRNEAKAKEVATTLSPIPTRTFPVDFASFASVRTAAQHVLAMDEKIDVLVNNIGTMASPYYKTEDGFESQLQLNHLSFFLFTNLIMDKLLASKTRIVNITSEGYSIGGIRYHDWNFHDGEAYNPFLGYGQGKTGQILFASALAAKLGKKGILAYSVQPGHTRGTNLHSSWGPYTIEQLVDEMRRVGHAAAWSVPEPKSADENLANFVLAAFDPALEKDNGAYIRDSKVIPLDDMEPWAVDERQQRKCWAFSERLVGQTFAYD